MEYLLTAAIGKHEDRFKDVHEYRFIEYANHWNMKYEPTFSGLDVHPHSHFYWSKMKLLADKLAAVPDNDIVNWIDADVCILRGDIKLYTKKSVGVTFDVWNDSTKFLGFHDNIITGDHRLNVGVMSVRANDFTRNMFKNIFLDTRFDNTTWPDQIAFIEALRALSDAQLEEHVEILPRELNVTLESKGIDKQNIRFRHFAGEFHLGWPLSFHRRFENVNFDCKTM